jgi:hypothetical protein
MGQISSYIDCFAALATTPGGWDCFVGQRTYLAEWVSLQASVLSEHGNLPRMAQTGVQASFVDRWGCILSEQHLDPNAQDQDGQE